MNTHDAAPRALFISPDGSIYPDTLICSGVLPAELGGKACPFSHEGRIPDSQPLDPRDANYTIDKGQPGDLCPPCAKQQLAHLGHWVGHLNGKYPAGLLPLRLFKCRQWFWLVVPGLHDNAPKRLSLNGNETTPPHE